MEFEELYISLIAQVDNLIKENNELKNQQTKNSPSLFSRASTSKAKAADSEQNRILRDLKNAILTSYHKRSEKQIEDLGNEVSKLKDKLKDLTEQKAENPPHTNAATARTPKI